MWRDGLEESKIVEVYPKRIISTEAVTEPYFKVKGREFTRTLYVQGGRPDIFMSQAVEPSVTYIHERNLPRQAINSRSQLQDAIYECPSSWLYDKADSMTDENWLDVAKVFSGYAQDMSVLESAAAFGVKGDHAFGTVLIMRDRSAGEEWVSDRWDRPGESINLSVPCTTCTMCQQAHTFQQDHNTSLVVALNCGHIFHKSCAYPWIWSTTVHNHNQAHCPTCGEDLHL
ncbi:hypothetical protein Bca4012_012798 [Brassica carinata]